MEGRRKKKGKKTKQMNANSQISKYWSQFCAHYVQGDSKRIFACFCPGKHKLPISIS